ncbi:hypothetical protein GZH47_22690 [Paenibacillus rhizovicinus]|uniref:Uncharacterized protein n=1 Tax=Paenibacillus rhizovicinus TaxID=2704463 RepID=A0A6C0P9W8_9BACL|nr:hypothetical protein [Paenibacillus rhizovicinus]QHW33322.1 hypothetical protein GZH47_22690 [Paenibacillus rhizovicinus]
MNNELTLIVERLETRQTLQALMPEKAWDAALDQRIAELPIITAATPSGDKTELIALMAGLHLLNESLDASHAHAQEIEDDPTGAYWHGIMHRMEGDFSNANYWFHNAGPHPAMQKLQDRAADWVRNSTVLSDLPEGAVRDGIAAIARQVRWNASAFTAMVALQESGGSSEDTRGALEYIQHLELEELFAHTEQAARHLLA